jgi:hypothetical protein
MPPVSRQKSRKGNRSELKAQPEGGMYDQSSVGGGSVGSRGPSQGNSNKEGSQGQGQGMNPSQKERERERQREIEKEAERERERQREREIRAFREFSTHLPVKMQQQPRRVAGSSFIGGKLHCHTSHD